MGLSFPRTLSIAVMIFTGSLMVWAFNWTTSLPSESLGMHHAGIIAAVFAPVAGIFKFAFDFAGDGKIDIKQ
ncbi:hypothetical protein ACFO4O_04280 [Glaciecola siphonariae]|uniref:Uncharacterized protein n=1 Tax=Glaciecola siphonariae TaxID=521012 RepID=A0ABV9LSX1_9ALTE